MARARPVPLTTRLMASAIYRGINAFYGIRPGADALRSLLHFNKYVEQATWMVVCRHFAESRARNNMLMRFTQTFLKAHIGPRDAVLDVGCHQGHLTRYIASLCGRVVGIDTNERALDRARQATSAPNVEFRAQDVRALSPEERFDVVSLHHVLEHLEDPAEVLSSLARVSSRALIEVPDIEQSWVRHLLRDLGGDYFSDATHVREYDRELISDHMARSGWRIVELRQVAGVLQVCARVMESTGEDTT